MGFRQSGKAGRRDEERGMAKLEKLKYPLLILAIGLLFLLLPSGSGKQTELPEAPD